MQDMPRASPIQPAEGGQAEVERSFWLGLLNRWWHVIAMAAALVFLIVLALPGSPPPGTALPQLNPAATGHAPWFIAEPGASDKLLNLMAVVLIATVLFFGVFFFWLHALPERLVHRSSKFHIDLVAVLALLSLFTHIHAFWVAALLLAFVKVPDISRTYLGRSLERMTSSLERIADGPDNPQPRTEALGSKRESDSARPPPH
jgi:ABC-type multidrug transport system fused ATPase/permease subunit